MKLFHLPQALGDLPLGTADATFLFFALALQGLQPALVALGAGRQGALLRAPGLQGLQAQHLALVAAEQLRTLLGLFLLRLLERLLGLLDMREQGLLGALGFAQGPFGAVGPMVKDQLA